MDDMYIVYLELAKNIMLEIISGKYHVGQKLPSIRCLAEMSGVCATTAQKALIELEHIGLIYTEKTNGKFVTQDSETIQICKNRFMHEQVQTLKTKMQMLGYSAQDTISMIEKSLEIQG